MYTSGKHSDVPVAIQSQQLENCRTTVQHTLKTQRTSCAIWRFPARHGGTPIWMVYKGNPMKMNDLGVPLFQQCAICWWFVVTIDV